MEVKRAKCFLCKEEKEAFYFYKNSRKKNGLESSCKSCVLTIKRKKRLQKRRTLSIRNSTSVRVLNVDSCTFDERQIIRPRNMELRLDDLVGELLWQKEQRGLVE